MACTGGDHVNRDAPGRAGWSCLPSVAKTAPTGPHWVYEITHDGYRLLVRKQADRCVSIRADSTKRFLRIADAVRRLKVTSIMIDGEGIICRPDGSLTSTCCIRKEHNATGTLCAFDPLEHDGDDVRLRPQ